MEGRNEGGQHWIADPALKGDRLQLQDFVGYGRQVSPRRRMGRVRHRSTNQDLRVGGGGRRREGTDAQAEAHPKRVSEDGEERLKRRQQGEGQCELDAAFTLLVLPRLWKSCARPDNDLTKEDDS
jgi:hypothetical protein